MALRGEAHRAAIRAVLDAFGADARHFVFGGGCTLGLYARPDGAPLRATKDVDCISTLVPWVLQEKFLGDMCSRGVLSPDADLQCRYRIRGTELDVDVLSPVGLNVGGVNPWFGRATQRARAYDVGEGRSVMALTPSYFLTTKLVAFEDRGPDAQSSKDAASRPPTRRRRAEEPARGQSAEAARLHSEAGGRRSVVDDATMLVVDPWHWLTEDGHFLFDNPRLYRRMLRIARFIEYGGPLQRNETRETLIECRRRPKGKPCIGLMWVVKAEDDGILAHCIACKTEETFVHNWQKTEWADGMMVPVTFDAEEPLRH